MTPIDIVTKIQALIGLSASLGGYRKDVPSEADESSYQELWLEVDAGLIAIHIAGHHAPAGLSRLAAITVDFAAGAQPPFAAHG